MEQDRTNGRAGSRSAGNGKGAGVAVDEDIRLQVATRLRDLGQRITPTEISDIWVFPPLPHLEGSSEFLLFTRFLPDEMRYLCGVEFTSGNGNGSTTVITNDSGNGSGGHASGSDRVRRITEYGAVPTHRVSRVVDGFRARLGDHREPLHFAIGGCADNWSQLVDREEPDAD